MTVFLVVIGFVAGAAAAIVSLASGAGLGAALLSYIVFGSGALVAAGVFVGVLRVWRARQRRARELDADDDSDYALARVTVPVTPSQAAGASARPSTRSGFVGGGMITSGSTSNPNLE